MQMLRSFVLARVPRNQSSHGSGNGTRNEGDSILLIDAGTQRDSLWIAWSRSKEVHVRAKKQRLPASGRNNQYIRPMSPTECLTGESDVDVDVDVENYRSSLGVCLALVRSISILGNLFVPKFKLKVV